MIIDIQRFIKEILEKHTNVCSENIFLTPTSSHTPKPSISIILSKGIITPTWKWEKAHLQESHSKIQRKYTLTQPFFIIFAYNDKEGLINDAHQFLKHLPRYGFSQQVEFTPIDIEYQLAEGMLGSQQAIITLNTEYGIINKYTHPLIKNVSIQTKYE